MAKYDVAFKLAVVKAYENNEGGHRFLARKFNIPSYSTVQKWIKVYQALGEEELERKSKTYTVQFKLDVLNYKLRTDKSYQEVTNTFGMSEYSLIFN